LGITLPEDFVRLGGAAPGNEAAVDISDRKTELSSEQKVFLSMPLYQFVFTTRTTNFLKRVKLERVGDLVVLKATQLQNMQGLGAKSLQELTAFLSDNEIQFGRIPEWSEELALAWEKQFSSRSNNRRQLDPYLHHDPAPKSLDQETRYGSRTGAQHAYCLPLLWIRWNGAKNIRRSWGGEQHYAGTSAADHYAILSFCKGKARTRTPGPIGPLHHRA
jgi:hypothetical protein